MTQSPDVLQEAAIEAAFRAIAGDEADPHMCPEAWEHAETVALAVLSTLPQQAATDEGEGFTPMIEWVVELARRDIKREQTDFIGRMNQAMGEFEAICDDYPDGELNEAARDDAGEALAALAGLAIAQLAMVGWPDDPLAALSTPTSQPPAAETRLREALETAIGLLWEHIPGIAPRIEALEAALTQPEPTAQQAAGEAEAAAWLYTSEYGDKELLLDCNSEYARRLLENGYTEQALTTPQPTETQRIVAWQPIETAPKDGTHFIGLTKDGRATTMSYREHVKGWKQKENGGWVADGHHMVLCEEASDSICPRDATYWMPLPEAPASGEYLTGEGDKA